MEQINTYKKGPIPPQDQAFQTNNHKTQQAHHINPPTKKERACMMILESGTKGITGLDIQVHCHVICGRNYPSELKRETGVNFRREWEENREQDGRHKRHWLLSRHDAKKLLMEINGMRYIRGADPISPAIAQQLLSLYQGTPEQTS